MSFHVPSVDITPYVTGGTDAEKAAVAAAIDRACREVGFIQILGHGMPVEISEGLAASMDAFFAQDLEAKKAFRTPPGVNRGYSPPKSESLSLSLGVEPASRMNDFFEAFNIGDGVSRYPEIDLPADTYSENLWPDTPDFEAKVSAYYEDARRVAWTMTEIFEDALGLDRGFFAGIADHSIDVMRMNNYALPEGTDVTLDGELMGMSEHTDYGIVTILWADQVAGLQVLGTDGSWNDVQPADGALLINLGDVTGRLTNEQWMSTLHRVKPPVIDGTIQRRRSAAYFHDGNYDAIVAPLPSLVDEEHPAVYEPITVGDHIAAKLAGSRAGKLNTADERATARVLSSGRY